MKFKERLPYTEETLMPYGDYVGTPLKDVPPSELKSLWEEGIADTSLREYIQLNKDSINKRLGKEAISNITYAIQFGEDDLD